MPKKPKLGQNFLVDENACLRIAGALGDVSQGTVVEIGPGHGAITGLLAPRCARLHCIEFDPALARELTFRFRNDAHVTIHNSDILLHLFRFAREGTLSRAVLMMQREVAQRIAAAPGVSDYGPLSAFTQLHAHVTELFTLPPSAFNPSPDVFSTVLRLDFAPRFAELGVDAESFNKFLRASFAQKRKTLTNNLRAAGYTATQLETSWPATIPAQARSEAVPLEAMAALYRALASGV